MKNIYLGINVSHGASASLIINGEIILAFQEERFNKIKNFVGYPKKSIDKCIDYIKSKNLIINEAAFSTINNPIFPYKYPLDNFFSIKDWFEYYSINFYSKKQKIREVKKIFNLYNKKNKKIDQYLDFEKIKEKDYFDNPKLFREIQCNFLKKQSRGLIKKISFIDHHTCHAYYAAFAPNIKEPRTGILTIDGEGDGLNQTFWMFDKKINILKKINQSKENDLARVYRFITLILKMKPNEHEFKVMGLAPYAKNEYSLKVYNEVFKNILTVKNCKIIHKKRPKDLFNYLYTKTKNYRFDNIAGGVQIFVEDIVTKLVKQISKKYKLKSFSISGGVSMNIKMNLALSKLKCVKNIYVPPTGTDESLSIGACYYLNRYKAQKFLKNIYLGQNISDEIIDKKKILDAIKNKKNILIYEKTNHKSIAKILNKGEIVAVARDREEFGARALGNRSIIANPSIDGIVEKINEQIKNRDFWMPFALTILENTQKKFLKNDKKISSDFMTIGFETFEKNYDKIKNGTHFYDKTARPQILQKNFNPKFYSIINEFYKISNIPAVLNTSLNLHGYPVSSTLKDVIFTFLNSNLKYLYINDNILIKKKQNL
jgi:carbamoyltransferase